MSGWTLPWFSVTWLLECRPYLLNIYCWTLTKCSPLHRGRHDVVALNQILRDTAVTVPTLATHLLRMHGPPHPAFNTHACAMLCRHARVRPVFLLRFGRVPFGWPTCDCQRCGVAGRLSQKVPSWDGYTFGPRHPVLSSSYWRGYCHIEFSGISYSGHAREKAAGPFMGVRQAVECSPWFSHCEWLGSTSLRHCSEREGRPDCTSAASPCSWLYVQG